MWLQYPYLTAKYILMLCAVANGGEALKNTDCTSDAVKESEF
jgi:hypothetical protein